MFELSQLHLQLAFVAACTLGEDVENQPGTIEHPALQGFLQIAFLARTEGMIEQHQFGLMLLDRRGNLVELACPDEMPCIRLLATAFDELDRNGACGSRQLLELKGVLLILFRFQIDMHEDCGFTAIGSFKEQEGSSGQTTFPGASSSSSTGRSPEPCVGILTERAGTTVEMACLYTI